MDRQVVKQLGRIHEAAIAAGFEHVELHREWREHATAPGERLSGWALELGREDPPADGCFFVLQAVLEEEGDGYADEVIDLVWLWARAGRRDVEPPSGRGGKPLSDLGFLIRHLSAQPALLKLVGVLHHAGFSAHEIAAACREVFTEPEAP